MRRNTVAIAVAVLATFAVVVWLVATRSALREQAQSSIAEKVEPGKGLNEKGRKGKGSGAAIAVEAAIARGAKTTTDIRAIGSLRSDESVQIASEIAGRIEKINFTEGGTVAAGDVLVKLDDNLAEAQVADAKARFELAESNNERAKKLSPSGFVTGKAIDEAAATFETARATLELERVRLAKHVIKAPFSGVVGLRKVSPGSFIGVGTTIVNLEKIDVLKLDFKLPEQFLPSVNIGQAVDVIVDAHPGRTFVGEIYAIDPLVDVNGRALAVAGAPAERRHGSAPRPVRQGAGEGQADARGGAGARERHRAARRRDFPVPHRRRQGDGDQSKARRAAWAGGRDPRRRAAQYPGRDRRPAQAAQRRGRGGDRPPRLWPARGRPPPRRTAPEPCSNSASAGRSSRPC